MASFLVVEISPASVELGGGYSDINRAAYSGQKSLTSFFLLQRRSVHHLEGPLHRFGFVESIAGRNSITDLIESHPSWFEQGGKTEIFRGKTGEG